ncbi:MAG: acyl-CoA thioesterase II [Candidatus Sericytochromatia bacterium]|nr:acyl-CoA thioesterase II [Candidatus Sericytochromatia bacterium]
MSRSLDDLLALLDLEPLDVDLFRGRSPATSRQRVFGGQVAGQALIAASRTVAEDRLVHSLHAYFVRPGDPATSIIYAVERIRDGRSFSTRGVVARQHGQTIFHMSASFQVGEPGLDHQEMMPQVPPPEGLPTPRELVEQQAGAPVVTTAWDEWNAIDLRVIEAGAAEGGHQRVWLRIAEPMPDAPLLHVCALAYASDLTLLSAALAPHGLTYETDGLQVASLDHAMWFHRPCRADEWLLYDQVSPSTSGGRGLASGRIFTQDGRLVASVIQEGQMRLVPTH